MTRKYASAGRAMTCGPAPRPGAGTHAAAKVNRTASPKRGERLKIPPRAVVQRTTSAAGEGVDTLKDVDPTRRAAPRLTACMRSPDTSTVVYQETTGEFYLLVMNGPTHHRP